MRLAVVSARPKILSNTVASLNPVAGSRVQVEDRERRDGEYDERNL
jgi:hypothetical protein